MIVCVRCLQRNDDDAEFCVSCGAYLEWASDRPVSPARSPSKRRVSRDASRAASGESPRPTKRPSGQRPVASRRREEHRTEPPQSGAHAAPADFDSELDAETQALRYAAQRLRERTEAARRGSPPPPSESEGPARRAAARTRAPAGSSPRRQTAPPDPPRPPPAQPLHADAFDGDLNGPGLVQPRMPDPRDDPPRVRQQTAVEEDFAVHAGDVACPRCGAGNAPSRHFCRRCGTALHADGVASQPTTVAAVVPVRRRWWWRFTRRLEDVPDTPAAPPDWKSRTRGALPLVLVVALLAGALGPWRSGIAARIESVRKRVAPRYVNVHPARVEASSFLLDHPPEAAVDGAPNTYWAEDGPGDGDREGLIFTFDRPVDVGRIGFYNGAQAKPQDFLAQPRLRMVRLMFDNGESVTLSLKDQSAFQSHSLGAEGVRSITLLITSVYPSALGGNAASLGEVEFFTRT